MIDFGQARVGYLPAHEGLGWKGARSLVGCIEDGGPFLSWLRCWYENSFLKKPKEKAKILPKKAS